MAKRADFNVIFLPRLLGTGTTENRTPQILHVQFHQVSVVTGGAHRGNR